MLEETIRRFPDRVEPAVLLGQLALQQNDLAGAAKALESAAQADPTRSDVRELMGMVCMSTGNWTPCIDSLVAGLEKAPEDGIVRLQLASAYREAGQGEKAQGVLMDHVARFPKDATGHLLLAQLYLDNGEAQKALDSVGKGMLLSPVTEAFVLEFLALRALGKKDEAMAVVSRFGARDQDAFSLMAQALLEQGRLPEAEDVLKGWKAHKPDDPEPSLLLAMVYRASIEPPRRKLLKENYSGVFRRMSGPFWRVVSRRRRHKSRQCSREALHETRNLPTNSERRSQFPRRGIEQQAAGSVLGLSDPSGAMGSESESRCRVGGRKNRRRAFSRWSGRSTDSPPPTTLRSSMWAQERVFRVSCWLS